MTASKTKIREHIEWTNLRWNNAPDTTSKRILLVGDSIVVGHGDMVHELLKDKYCIDYIATAKCVSDIDYMTELNYVLSCRDYELVVFNNGLHGFEISDKDYEANLKEVLTELNKRVKKLAWRTSTPIREKSNLNELEAERTPTVLKRNAFAAKVCKSLNIPILDLYTPMAENSDYFSPDAIHYNEQGKAVQAEMVAEFIKDNI